MLQVPEFSLAFSTGASMPSDSEINEVDPRSPRAREPRRSAQKTVLEARQRLTSSSGTRAAFDFELLDQYAGSRIGSALPMALVLIILALLASFWIPPLVALFWAGLVIAANTAVVLVCRQFKLADKSKFNAARWSARFIAAEIFYGVIWSSLSLFSLVALDPHLSVVMFAMVLIGTASNSVVTRTLPLGTLMSTAPAVVTVGVHLAVLGGTLNYALATIVVGAFIFFVFLARQLHRSELKTITHQAEKDSLINELEEARQMSEEARRHAEQANVAKSQFLATMSHELRTPLNAIIGFSEVLKSELLGPHQVPQYKEYAGDIHSSGQHLLNLINELLDLSRIEAGKYDLNEEAVSLIDIAEDCRRMVEIRARAKGIELSCTFGDNLPKLWAMSAPSGRSYSICCPMR